MAISEAQAVTYFDGKTKGQEFYAQRVDGIVERCVFYEWFPDDEDTPTTAVIFFGIRIYPTSQDYKETYFNLAALGTTENYFIDFKDTIGDLTFSP